MAPRLVVRRRRPFGIPYLRLSLSSTRPQIQRTHDLLDVVTFIHFRRSVSLATPALLSVQNRTIAIRGSKEQLRANSARVPSAIRGAIFANEMTQNVSALLVRRYRLRQVLVVLVAVVGYTSDSGMEIGPFDFLACIQSGLRLR
jgi:hypothetical protein